MKINKQIKIIAQVREEKNGQKRVTIPKENKDINDKDYVEVKKIE